MMNLPEPESHAAHHLWQINIHSHFEGQLYRARRSTKGDVIDSFRSQLLNNCFVHAVLIRDNIREQLEDE